ncbi:unnamed protein product [Caenorhabditis brenneri]
MRHSQSSGPSSPTQRPLLKDSKLLGINVDKPTLIHNQAYPSCLHLMFSRLMELYVSTEEILDNNPMLIFIAQRYFSIQDNGNP